MAVALSDNALLAASDLTGIAAGGMPSGELTGYDATEILGLCDSASEIVTEYLRRDLFVSERTMIFSEADWMKSDHEDYDFQAWAQDWPIVEVTSATTILAGRAAAGGQMIYSATKHREITAFCGYMRHDQVLADLQASPYSYSITETPLTLPYLVRDVAGLVALALMMSRIEGRFSGGRKIQQVGSESVSIDVEDPNHIPHLLQRLSAYRCHRV